jgi:pimeloyl-ACP methyl ester carboxylesterase
MRSMIIGAILIVLAIAVALVVVRQFIVEEVKGDLAYRFNDYVFDQTEFPAGDFEQGRLVRRALFPARATPTFYDAQYNEVKEAAKPGRYGAVIRMDLGLGVTVYRFVTLYRTPTKAFLWETAWPMTVQVPSNLGIDPAVLNIQQPEIGDVLKGSFVSDGDGSPYLAVLLAGLAETSPNDPPAVARTNVMSRDAVWWDGLRQRLGLTEKYAYLLDLPNGYDADPGKRWPLILFLHDGQESGNDLRHVRLSGLAKAIGDGRQVPAIVVSPQCPSNSEGWSTLVLSHLIDDISAKYRVDADRIYVTGCSAGGDGTWDLALAYPERFAAIVPMCGESDPADGARLKNLPIWVFHGQNDQTVPLNQTTDMLDVIRKAGGHPHLTIVPNSPHNVWDHAYAQDDLYTWMFAQKRGQPEVITPGVDK